MKNIIVIVLVIVVIALGAYFLIPTSSPTDIEEDQETLNGIIQLDNKDQGSEGGTVNLDDRIETILGKSVGGRDIPIYQYGEGDTEILFVGGIHGGYEWNTSYLAYETMNYFEENPDIIPENIKVTVIPVLNPDGLSKVQETSNLAKLATNPPQLEGTIVGRFNANDVDLNRNFDCDWQTNAKWQDKTVSGGTEVFSEAESQAMRDYIESEKPAAVIVWYSSAGGVFSSSCHNGILEETKTLTNTYAKASGYPAYDEFTSYEVTGDMVNWLAKKNIPAISVLLTTHNDIEWSKNKAGIEAVLNYYSKE